MTRSILITGCASGIGRDAAFTLSKQGWRVFATCRQEKDCATFRAEGIESFRLDYTDPASIDTALAQVLDATGGTLDTLFNNGAMAVPGAVEDLPPGALREIFETNVVGWHDLTTRVIPVMRAQGHGRIVHHSSVLGYVPLRWRGAYVASKHALEGLTDTLRLEMSDTPIDIVTLNTGPIGTNIRVNSIPYFEKWVDWKSSPRRDQYESTLLKRLYESSGPDTFELTPGAVTKVLIRALDAQNPRPRYYITTPSKLMSVARRVLSTRMLDRLILRGG
ncbi:SDR family NAD(P)-dependent oxidoreductase [Allosediminivita pacifica]|uniref:Short-subunit dehydrogenase n=1 Tax=Allosediminivita pacifica TaxID=1267769 RepID=A0A2T6AS69_9RHOB|nr:SDR family NAD(P)-dependent oxidoreductase [Allosediminivita pacifica]PTX46661.1 short-subunit dehydrogenase [Allosediminivita pacifica]GGB15873.1 short-chain dehydrogenase/reductase [Allosediminivita pacifica]